MKNLRLLRWSGPLFSPRTRSIYSGLHQVSTLRLQSLTTASLAEQPDSPLPPYIKRLSDDDLRQYPSPPPELSRSSAKLAALRARILPHDTLIPVEALGRCLVDPSADPHPQFNNLSLALLGHDLLGYYTSEYILCRYPRLPMTVIFSAMAAYCGPKALARLASEWGVDIAAEPGGEVDPGLLQFKRVVAGNADLDGTGVMEKERKDFKPKKAMKQWKISLAGLSVNDNYFGVHHSAADYAERPELCDALSPQGTTLEFASAAFVRAVLGVVYLHGGRRAAKTFFREHFLSRHLDVSKLFVFNQPTRDLSKLCVREGFESPVARILAETGRLSRHPVFVVGVYSGKDKLGEGQGGSLDEARIRAAINALKGWYLYSPVGTKVPSDVEGGEGSWEPVLIDGGEIIV